MQQSILLVIFLFINKCRFSPVKPCTCSEFLLCSIGCSNPHGTYLQSCMSDLDCNTCRCLSQKCSSACNAQTLSFDSSGLSCLTNNDCTSCTCAYNRCNSLCSASFSDKACSEDSDCFLATSPSAVSFFNYSTTTSTTLSSTTRVYSVENFTDLLALEYLNLSIIFLHFSTFYYDTHFLVIFFTNLSQQYFFLLLKKSSIFRSCYLGGNFLKWWVLF